MLNSMLLAFAMYSKIPVPRADWSKEKMKYVMVFFPLIGLVIGLLMWLFGQGCLLLKAPELFRSAGFVLIPLLVTGGIHMDGFLDTTDALSSWQSKERKLEILKDSHTGAFAIIFAGIYLVAMLGIWSCISGDGLVVLAISFAFSRGLSGMSVVTFQNARKEGLLATFSGNAEKVLTRAALVVWLFAAALAMCLVSPAKGGAAVTAGLLVFAYYRYRSYKEFGGITGDLAGWFLQICELFMALAVAVCGMILS